MSMFHPTVPRLAARTSAIGLAALALSLSACGSSGGGHAASAGSSNPASSGPMLGATFKGYIYVATATSHTIKDFTYKVKNVRNCAAAVQSGDTAGTWKVPSPSAPDPQADIEVTGFHGPGTYTPTMMLKDKADSILLTGKSGTSQYVISSAKAKAKAKVTPGKEVLFLRKSGAGELVYSNAHLDGQAADPEVAGEITWSCSS